MRDNKNADYIRCAKILNDVNKDNNFSRGIKLKNNQNVLITKYVEGQSVTGKEAYNFVHSRGRILFDYNSEGNVRKNKEGNHVLIDADLAAQPKGLYRTSSIGTINIHDIFNEHHEKQPVRKNKILPLYYRQLSNLLK